MRKNKVRTIVTVIGIVLSAAMFTAVTTIISSLLGYFREVEIDQSGDWHIHAMAVSGENASAAAGDARVEKCSMLENIGYAAIDSRNPDKPYACVQGGDDTFFGSMPVHLTRGRLPLASNEVLIPEHLASNGGVHFAVDQVIELELGSREGRGELEGVVFDQSNPFYEELETLSGGEKRSFAIVGFYERPDFEPYSAPGYTFLTKMDGVSASKTYECYFRIRDPQKNLNAFAEQNMLREYAWEEHTGLLALEGYSRYDNINRVMTNFAAILFVLIFAGSVALIFSAFSISVSERTRQFGLLASVGATRKQIRRSVFTEALALSAVGIPLGILSGVGGIALTLYLLRDKFAGLISNSDLPMHITVTWPALAISAAVALVTVLVSAWIPSRRAMKVSPIEAIRQARDVKSKGRADRSVSAGPIARIFGVEGVLASKYYKRSHRKYVATIISLAMSVVLFVSASALCMYLSSSVGAVDNTMDFDGYYSNMPASDFDRFGAAFREQTTALAAYVGQNEREDREFRYAYLTAANCTEDYMRYLKVSRGSADVSMNRNAAVFYMDDDSFRALIEKYGLDEADYFTDGTGKALALNHDNAPYYTENERHSYVFDYLKSGETSVMLAKPIPELEGYSVSGVYWTGSAYGEGELRAYYVPTDEECEFDANDRPVGQPTALLEYEEIAVGKLITDEVVGAFSYFNLELIFPASAYKGSSGDMNVFFRSDNVQKTISAMTAVMEAGGATVPSRAFYDATEDTRLMNNVITIIKVFSYGFIALISLISVANVFNTVTTNVALRRRDYAMLRSMGMTKKGINRMTNYECLIYGSRALLIGFPVALLFTYAVYRVASDAARMKFTIPVTAAAIAAASVFIVVFASMIYSTGKLKKDNPIDALKDENI